MSRIPRHRCESNIYHVILRGINKQDIFEEAEDMLRFLTILKECKRICGFQIYAYCLMSNHVHILIRIVDEPLETVFKRIGVRYVYWYNLKNQRVGHLFQDRYRSETVETDGSVMRAFRYILQNPMKAGLENTPGHYRWSSYQAYAGEYDDITDVGFVTKLFQSRKALLDYLHCANDYAGLDVDERNTLTVRLTDERAREIMQDITRCGSLSEFQSLGKEIQKEYAQKLWEAKLSYGQIARVTGLSKTTIYRAVNKVSA